MAPTMFTPPPASLPPASLPPPRAPPQSMIDRTQRFLEEHWVPLLLGAGVLAAGGVYYYSQQNDRSGPSSGEKKDRKERGKGKKRRSGQGRNFSGEGNEGPLLEELPEEKAEKGPATGPSTGAAKGATEEKEEVQEGTSHLNDVPDADGIADMSESDRNALGVTLKDRGNKLYSKKDFRRAVECYTKAIEVSVKKDSVFFSNRAACYTNFTPPEYENCVADCDSALELDRTYVKALKRRATALEHLGRDDEAVRDFTATSILERFKDEQAAGSVERCLTKLAQKRAKEMLDTREAKLPSPTFISQYLLAFRPHDKPTLPENPSQGDQTLLLAFDALAAADYNHALTFANEAIDQGVSWKEGQAEAYNLRGTFKFLMGDSIGAKIDLEKSLDLVPSFVQSWVKIASVHMELGDAASAFGDFEAAIRHNQDDPDIYYHRGQVYFISQEFDKAIADYKKSAALDGTFIFTHIQEAVAQYKQGSVASSMAAFRRILKQFPDRGEPNNYYGELLLDQQKFQESVERFDKSLELDKNRRPVNVLPYVNKSLAIFQWKQDIVQAESLCNQALAIDPDCDVAVATLAQLSLQQGKIEEAIKWFEKSAKLARTEGELVNSLTYEHASRAQQAFVKNYPEYAEILSQSAPQM